MYFGRLASTISSGPNKGKQAIVEITSAKSTVINSETGKPEGIRFGDTVSYTDENGKDHVGIAAEQWEYPQFGPEPGRDDKSNYLELTEDQANEALQEMIKDAGGIVRLVENYNDATQKASLNTGKNFIRTKEGVTPDSADKVVEEGLRRSKEFTWAGAERVTNKSVRESAEKLEEEIEELSKDEIIARFRAMLGKKSAA